MRKSAKDAITSSLLMNVRDLTIIRRVFEAGKVQTDDLPGIIDTFNDILMSLTAAIGVIVTNDEDEDV